MLRCADSSLYTGVAKDWRDRLELHMNGRAAKYTRSRRPVRLVRLERHASKSAALEAQAAVKRLPEPEKEHYVLGGRARLSARGGASVAAEPAGESGPLSR